MSSISVVIGAVNPGPEIFRCLRAVDASAKGEDVDVVVATGSTSGVISDLHVQFPRVRVLKVPGSLTIHSLRAVGIAAAGGEVVAILDASSIVSNDWVARTLHAHRTRTNAAIGGAVDLYAPESQSLLAWAIYFYEYARFMPPITEGSTELLAGCNVSYKRKVLFESGGRPRFAVFWKDLVNRDIRKAGEALWLDPTLLVRSQKSLRYAEFLQTRFRNGRCFAGMRARQYGGIRRLVYWAGTPLLPLILLWRCMGWHWLRHRYGKQFALSLPLQALLFVSWSAGESAGYLFGAGASCEALFY